MPRPIAWRFSISVTLIALFASRNTWQASSTPLAPPPTTIMCLPFPAATGTPYGLNSRAGPARPTGGEGRRPAHRHPRACLEREGGTHGGLVAEPPEDR